MASSDFEGITELVLEVLESRGLHLKLLKAIIEKEIDETGENSTACCRSIGICSRFPSLQDHESTMFRANTPATRLLTAFARSHGYGYSRFLVTHLLSTLATQPLGLSEMDMYTEADPEDDGLVRLEVGCMPSASSVYHS